MEITPDHVMAMYRREIKPQASDDIDALSQQTRRVIDNIGFAYSSGAVTEGDTLFLEQYFALSDETGSPLSVDAMHDRAVLMSVHYILRILNERRLLQNAADNPSQN